MLADTIPSNCVESGDSSGLNLDVCGGHTGESTGKRLGLVGTRSASLQFAVLALENVPMGAGMAH